MKLPHFLLNLLPLWSYICPKCKREVPKNSHKCPFCGERYGKPLKIPPLCLKSKEALERYVHEKVFPRISAKQRKYLAQFFTELFNDGFESGDFSNWTETYTTSGETAEVITTDPHHGSYHAHFAWDGSSQGEQAYIYKNLDTHYKTLYVRIYAKFKNQLPNANDRYIKLIVLYDMEDWTDRVWVTVYNDNGTVKWRLGGTGASETLGTSTVSLDTWYCVELGVHFASSDGWYKLWIDGDLEIEITGLSNDESARRVYVGCRDSGWAGGWSGAVYVDCVVVADTYIGPEGAVTEIQVSDSAIGQEVFSRPYREIPFTETALGQELLAKTRNLNLSDIATSLETIQKARQIGIVTDIAQGLERILKQRLITLADQASGLELTSRPTRIILITDEALSNEIIGKLRELTSITDSAIGIEYVSIGTEGITKTKIFLLLGDLAIQLTGN